MRFCPFCSAENADDLAVCQACGRRLPPLPPRRAGTRNAPPTGVQLPRPTGAPPSAARRAGNTLPPPVPTASPIATGLASNDSSTPARTVAASSPAPAPAAAPTPPVTTPPRPRTPSAIDNTWMDAEPAESTIVAPPPTQAEMLPDMTIPSASPYQTPPKGTPVVKPPSAPAPPPAPARDSAPSLPPPPDLAGEDKRRQLANALNPGPAAARRDAPADDRIIADRRNRTDSKAPLPPTALTRPNTPSQPPPPRPSTPSQPPPMRAHSPSAPPPIPRAASQPPVSRPPSVPPSPFAGDTFITDNDTKAAPWEVSQPAPGGPPPTRIQGDRPFSPPQVLPVPEIPEPGLVKAAKYAYIFARARWQRRGAIKQLGVEIRQDTEALDQVLGALGRAARGARVEGRVFSAENSAISNAEERVNQLDKEHAEVEGRKAEENSKFGDIERERNAKLVEAERMVDEAGRELANLEAQRRSLRDRRKDFERRQRANHKAAEDYDRQSGSAPMGEQRQELRKVAEGHRREASALEPERQEIDRQLGGLDRPISEVTARLDAGKAELDAAKRSLNDAREGHTHRLAELDAEQKRKTREIGLAQSEIARRLVTLGTLVNLNRIEDAQFAELYQRIDRLRSAITSRTTEIEKLTAEREAYDRGTLLRGVASIGGALLALIALIVILLAIV